MRLIFGILAAAAGLYSLLIFIRILLSWFGNSFNSSVTEFIKRITDPYLDWWRNALNLRVGFLDFSVVAAIAFLSLLQNILHTLSISERMTLGYILANILMSLWNIVSFILIFFIIIIILRAAAYLTNRNIYSPFWSVIENISQPVMYKMNRLIFGKKIGNYFTGIIIALIILLLTLILGRFLAVFLAGLLYGMPV